MEKVKFSFKTSEGCRWLLGLFVVLILVFSFCARLISTDGVNVKIKRVNIDSRGAVIVGDLYYPVNTSDKDKLPAVLVAHGGGCNRNIVRGFAEEIARRGFVVLNVDAYGAGLTESPLYDEVGQGKDGVDFTKVVSGMYDSLNYIRTLKFVDQTRIGMTGHSMGSRRSGLVGIMDCGYYTYNDIMINVLHDTFQQTFTKDEINKNADVLAEERLNNDQLLYYTDLKKQYRKNYDSMIKSVCLIGSDANLISPTQTVKVAGHEVMRNCQINFGVVSGTYDFSYKTYSTRDTTKSYWHTGGEEIALRTWYTIDDYNDTSKKLGGFSEISVVNNQELRDAIQNRTLRICMLNRETHSQNFFSKQTTADVVKYFEQTLGYNRGELTDRTTTALNSNNIVFQLRETLNLLAMLSMIGMIISLAALLLKTNYFLPCVMNNYEKSGTDVNKISYWVCNIITVIITFIAIHITNTSASPLTAPVYSWLPVFALFWLNPFFITLSIGSILLLAYYVIKNKKKYGNTGILSLNIKIKFKIFFKTLLLTAILFIAAYSSLAIIEYLFNQDYRFWMASFGEIKIDGWRYVWRCMVMTLPPFLIIGACTNYNIRKDILEWKDTLITVIVGSLGVWLCCFINQTLAYSELLQGKLFSTFIYTYGMLIIVPINVYITRKMYRLTNSIWLGALLNSLLVNWAIISAAGLRDNIFLGQAFVGLLLGK